MASMEFFLTIEAKALFPLRSYFFRRQSFPGLGGGREGGGNKGGRGEVGDVKGEGGFRGGAGRGGGGRFREGGGHDERGGVRGEGRTREGVCTSANFSSCKRARPAA